MDIHPSPGPLIKYENIPHNLKNYRDNIKVLHLSCRSLNRKQTELKLFVEKIGDQTVVAFSESQFDDQNVWTLERLKCVSFRSDRSSENSKKLEGV